MIKVAMQSAAAFAPNPDELLHSMNRILTPELRGRLTSAAYLWIDTESCTARYSAAGHPALLHWSVACGELLRIESNGLIFGVESEFEYPATGNWKLFCMKTAPCRLLTYRGSCSPRSKAGSRLPLHSRMTSHWSWWMLYSPSPREAPRAGRKSISLEARG